MLAQFKKLKIKTLIPLTRLKQVGISALLIAGISYTAAAQQAVNGFERFQNRSWEQTDFSKATIQASEIMSGGPPKDGIPSIDDPEFKPVDQIDDLGDNEPVIVFTNEGSAKAYPLRILMWHEIVNDQIAGMPISVTYCPLCNSSIVFDRRFEGELLDFGTTGLLRNSDLVMYDRQSQTWWQQFTGEGLVGDHAGKKLTMLPSVVVGFADFKEDFPNGRVLVPNDALLRNYGRNPYVGYDSLATPFLFNGDLPEGIDAMERVVYVRDEKAPLAVSLKVLENQSEIIRGDYRITWEAGLNSALDVGRISEGRDVGTIRVEIKNSQGEWNDAVHDITFAFVVNAFHPDVEIEKAKI